MIIKGIEQRPCVICKHKMSELKSEPCHSCTKTGDFSSPGFEEIGVKGEKNERFLQRTPSEKDSQGS